MPKRCAKDPLRRVTGAGEGLDAITRVEVQRAWCVAKWAKRAVFDSQTWDSREESGVHDESICRRVLLRKNSAE